MVAEVPQNGGYMIAAYLVTPVILVGYLVGLVRRLSAAGRKEAAG